jgi:glutamate formiminotransferase/formiminotetrahydrofolate cyclodeaminase
MKQIVECVANFSEGRRLEVVDAIAAAIAAVDQVYVLDRTSDPDHNRSVITFAGSPEPVVEAAFNAIASAAQLIDLDQHQGEHPRLGATDVVPFVPISEVTMDDCVMLARRLGQRVGDELNIPVYLYEAAATRPERQNLADVRRGEYEGLKDTLGKDPERDPDFGPKVLPKAGATIIGARAPLVAYNVYLTTDDVEIARKIAKAVRHATGGLHFVKALGMLVEGKAQVSMNLTDFARTPVFRVVEMIRREAARYGVAIARSELIGLIPQQAMFDSAQWYLQLDGFTPQHVLEVRLAEATTAEEAPESFIDAVASGSPTPGGGAVAAHSGALAAALVAMVARLTVGKKKYAGIETRMTEIIDEAESLRARLQHNIQADSDAFDAVMAAFRLPKDTAEQQVARAEAVEQATHRAAEVPLETVELAANVLDLAAEVAETGNVNAVSDAGSAGAMAQAALTASALNVRVNATSVNDRDAADRWLAAVNAFTAQAQASSQRLFAAIRTRAEIDV